MDNQTVQNIAQLAHIKIDPTDKTFIHALRDILYLTDQLKNAPVHDVLPLYNVHRDHLHVREDIPTEVTSREALQSLTPKFHDGFYWVPKIID